MSDAKDSQALKPQIGTIHVSFMLESPGKHHKVEQEPKMLLILTNAERTYGVRSLSFEERKVLEHLVQALRQVLRVQAYEVFQQDGFDRLIANYKTVSSYSSLTTPCEVRGFSTPKPITLIPYGRNLSKWGASFGISARAIIRKHVYPDFADGDNPSLPLPTKAPAPLSIY